MLYCALILFSSFICVINCNVVVSTRDGDILGYTLNLAGHNSVGSPISSLDVFLGIPYAEPPIHDLRFARPLPKRPWSPRRLNALRFSPACPQPVWFLRTYSFAADYNNFSEDCLYLNIYVPQNSADPNATYPVLFWIHGGSYRYGSGAEYDGRILAQEGVIVVTINYRVGLLGFLSTDDDVAPGNYGLLDQLTALKWVKDNIASFHGDPTRITIFGQSAGGGSVSLHMFSPKARGLFTSVIAQSGCAISPWAIYRPPHKIRTATEHLAASVGCTTSTSADMIACLRTQDVHVLIDAKVGAPPMISSFAPRVDGYYINDLPEVLLERGDYILHTNFMNGIVPNEVSEDFEDVAGIDNGLTKTQLEDLFRDKSSRYLDNEGAMYKSMTCAYPPSDTDLSKNRDHLINMNSDYGYNVPHIKLTEKMSAAGENTWFYIFSYRSPGSLKKQWIGVPHAEELYYIFGAMFLDKTPCPETHNSTCPVTWGSYQPWSAADERVSKEIMKLWADFARLPKNSTQFPSTGGTYRSWPQYTPGETYIEIGSASTSNTQLRHLQKTEGIRFWDSFNYLNLSEPIPNVCKQPNIVG